MQRKAPRRTGEAVRELCWECGAMKEGPGLRKAESTSALMHVGITQVV